LTAAVKDAKVEDPSARTDFRHPDLTAWVRENRGRLLWAVLTLGQAWITAGQPIAKGTAFGGFEAWAAVLGGVLDVAGIPGFLNNRRSPFEQADEEGAHVRAFLASWWRDFRDTPMATRELVEMAKGHELPLSARTEHGMLVQLGKLIKGIEDRQYTIGADLVVAVRRAGTESDKAILWRLLRRCAESPESTESPSVNASGGTGIDTKLAETDSAPSVDSVADPRVPSWVAEDHPPSQREQGGWEPELEDVR
jgi:putative DNA primase/helicase